MNPMFSRALAKAHAKAGAPGEIVEIEVETSTYVVEVRCFGRRRHRYQVKDGVVIVICDWQIHGHRTRKRGSAPIEQTGESIS